MKGQPRYAKILHDIKQQKKESYFKGMGEFLWAIPVKMLHHSRK